MAVAATDSQEFLHGSDREAVNNTIGVTTMKQILPHINIGLHEAGGVALTIDDYELFDFIEDYLTEECEILGC